MPPRDATEFNQLVQESANTPESIGTFVDGRKPAVVAFCTRVPTTT